MVAATSSGCRQCNVRATAATLLTARLRCMEARMKTELQQALQELPAQLQTAAMLQLERYFAQPEWPAIPADMLPPLLRMLACSEFAGNVLQKEWAWLISRQDALRAPPDRGGTGRQRAGYRRQRSCAGRGQGGRFGACAIAISCTCCGANLPRRRRWRKRCCRFRRLPSNCCEPLRCMQKAPCRNDSAGFVMTTVRHFPSSSSAWASWVVAN